MIHGERKVKYINSLPSLNESSGETDVSQGFIEFELMRFPICSGVSTTDSIVSEIWYR